MQKKKNNRRIEKKRCDDLLNQLTSIECKCNRIIFELSEVKNLISSSSTDVDRLIESLENSARELYRQSVRQREFVEQSMGGLPTMHIVRRDEYGL